LSTVTRSSSSKSLLSSNKSLTRRLTRKFKNDCSIRVYDSKTSLYALQREQSEHPITLFDSATDIPSNRPDILEKQSSGRNTKSNDSQIISADQGKIWGMFAGGKSRSSGAVNEKLRDLYMAPSDGDNTEKSTARRRKAVSFEKVRMEKHESWISHSSDGQSGHSSIHSSTYSSNAGSPYRASYETLDDVIDLGSRATSDIYRSFSESQSPSDLMDRINDSEATSVIVASLEEVFTTDDESED